MALPQVDLLVHGLGTSYANGTATAYLAGTSTLATWYSTADGSTIAANPYTLDAQGKAVLYCPRRIKIDVKNSAGVSAPGFPIDNLGYPASVVTGSTSILTLEPTGLYTEYDTLEDARTDPTAAGKTVYVVGELTGAQMNTTAAWPADRAIELVNSGTPDDALATILNVPIDYTNPDVSEGATLQSRYIGPKQITTSDGNKRGVFFSNVNDPPSSFGTPTSVTTAFNGDLSRCQFPVEHRVTGATTLTQPTTGYVYTPEAYPHYTFLYNSSGYNHATASNVGRTAVCAHRVKVHQYGAGDAVAYNASVFVTGTRAGSTHFLANPAGVLFNGDMEVGADGTYMNPLEFIMHDRGYDAACIGLVNNFDRTNETGAKSVFWGGYRAQSVGSKAIDSFLSLTGPAKVGLDFAMDSVDFGADQCAISLKANQRIYFNNASTASGSMEAGWRTNVFNGDYMTSDGTIFKIVKGGVASLQVRSNNVLVNTSDGLIISSTGNITFNGTSQYGTGTSTATFTATNKPGSSTGVGPTQWIKVILGTSTFYLPAWAE